MYEKFISKNFRSATLHQIAQAEEIISTYQVQGFKLTLRQLYYQFVARDLIPNTMREYQKLSRIVSDARLAGLLDWSAIEDRTRNVNEISHWDSPSDIIDSSAACYEIDKWANQPNRVEVWIEKEALIGIIEPVCERLDIDSFACRGYVSQSEQYDASKRFLKYQQKDQNVIILHLGDHDPSGIDMTRDNEDRLNLFVRSCNYDLDGVEVRRLALNYDQIELYNPPPNPAKQTDARFESYASRFGDESWELDALEPNVISDIIEDEILTIRDEDCWAEMIEQEQHERNVLHAVSDRWEEVVQFIERSTEE